MLKINDGTKQDRNFSLLQGHTNTPLPACITSHSHSTYNIFPHSTLPSRTSSLFYSIPSFFFSKIRESFASSFIT